MNVIPSSLFVIPRLAPSFAPYLPPLSLALPRSSSLSPTLSLALRVVDCLTPSDHATPPITQCALARIHLTRCPPAPWPWAPRPRHWS